MELLGRSRHQPLSVEFVSEASTRSFSWNFQTCVYSRWQSNNLRHWVRTVLHTVGLPMWLEISASCWFKKCFRWANSYSRIFKIVCNLPSAPRSDFGSYPWQGIIFNNNDYVATGGLISNMHFLTIAERLLNFTWEGNVIPHKSSHFRNFQHQLRLAEGSHGRMGHSVPERTASVRWVERCIDPCSPGIWPENSRQ